MDNLIIQYIVIALVFVVAVYFLVKRFMPSKGNGGCGKGCGCSVVEKPKK